MGKKPRRVDGAGDIGRGLVVADQHAIRGYASPAPQGPTPRPGEPHAVTRARERYGIEITERDLGEISRALGKDGILVARQPTGCIWLTKVKGVVVRVAVSHAGNIMTFLPPNHRLRKGRW